MIRSLALVLILVLAGNAAQADEILKAASTPAGQPASGLNQATGKWEGIAVELLTTMLEKSNRKVEFVKMNFGDLQSALTESRVDLIAASFGITPERARIVDFSAPYGSYRDVLLVPDSDKASYSSLTELKGVRIATSRGSAYVQPLRDAGADVIEATNPVEAILALKSGTVQGVVDNGLQLRFRVKEMNLSGFKIVDSYKAIYEGKLAYAVRKGDAATLELLNESLKKAEESGLLRTLKDKWSVQ